MATSADSMANGQQSLSVPSICLERDITQSAAFLDIVRRHKEALLPGQNEPVDFSQLAISPDGKLIAGVSTICKELKGSPTARLVLIDTDANERSTLLFGEREGSDKSPKWSKDGRTVSFLSQIDQCDQLHLLDLENGDIKPCTSLDGTIEQQSWSPDGESILLVVAGLGADRSTIEGATAFSSNSNRSQDHDMTWLPNIESTPPANAYRTLWTYDVKSGSCTQASPDGLNIWEAAWTTTSSAVAICSDLPEEEHWYRPSIREIDFTTKAVHILSSSQVAVESITASPNGSRVAYVKGIASDRGATKGDLYLLDLYTKTETLLDTKGVNVARPLNFCGEDEIVSAGSRDDEELVINYNCKTGVATEIWKSQNHSTGGYYMPEASSKMVNGEAHYAFVKAGWFEPPVLMYGSRGKLLEVKTFGSSQLHDRIMNLGTSKNMTWKAPDGLEIRGYLLTPLQSKTGPHPTILFVHGGPVWQWKPLYLGGHAQPLLIQTLLANGFAIFLPNVRGSSGRGQDYIKHVFGDMGGLDTHDYLSGLDILVQAGIADPARLGVYGGSYGGFISSWLITQTTRFAAAVPVAPINDWVSARYTANLGRFFDDFLGDDPHDSNGKYFTRSPLHHVRNVRTPSLTICGAKDRCTPPGQGVEFHQALVAEGSTSVLLTYPDEGHGIRQMPAYFDMAARTVQWFKYFLK